MIIVDHNISTGEITERKMTADELAQRLADETKEQAALTAEAQKAAEEAARLSAKLAIYAKLGLTEEEINTLIS